MNFVTTAALIEVLKSYTERVTIETATQKDWRNRDYKYDFVTVAKENNFGIEVLENEIIMFFMTNHYHFEDYSSELQADQENYVERAKAFLKELFESRIRSVEYYKGKTLVSDKYFLLFDDGREDEFIGGTYYSLLRAINPFAKKMMRTKTWQFDKAKGIFTMRHPKKTDPDAAAVIDASEDCYFEIMEANGCYTYGIMEICYDDYYGEYYWTPAANVNPSGIYDTKEKAIKAAWDAIKYRS